MFHSLLLRISMIEGNFPIVDAITQYSPGTEVLVTKILKKYHFFTGMGTKIEYSRNLLASSVDSNNFIVGGVDVWEHYQNKGVTNNHFSLGINKLQDPMDRMLDRNNIESIKKTMQMHEDIFKQQVSHPCCDLHLLILTSQKIQVVIQFVAEMLHIQHEENVIG